MIIELGSVKAVTLGQGSFAEADKVQPGPLPT